MNTPDDKDESRNDEFDKFHNGYRKSIPHLYHLVTTDIMFNSENAIPGIEVLGDDQDLLNQ